MRYVVATLKPWNIDAFERVISKYPGEWRLVTREEELTARMLREYGPCYVFFQHWSSLVGEDILDSSECICFHETDLPFGRGGSPLQNCIAEGKTETVISAIRMTKDIDAGPVYMKRPLSLHGNCEEIFLRAARTVAEMIREIAQNEPIPHEQTGKVTYFRRRTPEMSKLPASVTLEELFNHLRMLDAATYPRAFIRRGNFRISFSRPALYTGKIVADATITLEETE